MTEPHNKGPTLAQYLKQFVPIVTKTEDVAPQGDLVSRAAVREMLSRSREWSWSRLSEQLDAIPSAITQKTPTTDSDRHGRLGRDRMP